MRCVRHKQGVNMPLSVKEIEDVIAQLPKKQLRQFRTWYEQFDSEIWDEQIEQDTNNGAFDELAKQAIADHKAGKTKKL